jgi:hypothetical protein
MMIGIYPCWTRKALGRYEDVREGLTAIIRLINDRGLEPTATVEPLPEIDEQDVNVATWLHLCPVTFQLI